MTISDQKGPKGFGQLMFRVHALLLNTFLFFGLVQHLSCSQKINLSIWILIEIVFYVDQLLNHYTSSLNAL